MKALLTYASRILPIILWALVIYAFSAMPNPYSLIHAPGAEEIHEQHGPAPLVGETGIDLLNCNFSLRTDMAGWEAHIAEYALLAWLLARAIIWRGQPKPALLAAAFALTVIFALSDELHQLFVPNRGCELVDLGLDVIGTTMGLTVYLLARRYGSTRESG